MWGGGIIIEPNQSLLGLFDKKFDLIIANQSLYYLTPQNLKKIVEEMYELLKDDGFVFFTMMGEGNWYNNFRVRELDNGLSEVTISGRLEETTYINFVKNQEQLKEIFSPFKPIRLGEYAIELYKEYGGDGSTQHYIFIGEK